MAPPAVLGGLASDEARQRLAQLGPNTLEARRRGGWWRSLLDVVREPMVLLLVSCAVVYVAFGELSETLILGSSVVLVLAFTGRLGTPGRAAGRLLQLHGDG